MMKKTLILSILFLYTGLGICYAVNDDGDSILTKYKIYEEWYLQLQCGMNYAATENTRFVNFTKVLSPEMTMSFGKRLSPVWGARLQAVFGKDKGVFSPASNSPRYSFSHLGVMGIGSFTITEWLSRRSRSRTGYSKQFNVNALLGLGTIYTSFGFTKDEPGQGILDYNNSTYLAVFAGVEASYTLSRLIDFNVELSSNWMGNKYNGLTSVAKSRMKADGVINLLVGVRYTFNGVQRKFKPRGHFSTLMTQESVAIPASTTLRREAKHEEVKPYVEKEAETEVVSLPVPTEDYYSIEELLDMVNNKESLSGKQLSCTEHIEFDYGKNTIKPFASIYLDKVAQLLKKVNVVLIIKGVRTENSSNQLTEQRMKTVRDYLKQRGIDRNRLVYQFISKSSSFDENSIELGFLSL